MVVLRLLEYFMFLLFGGLIGIAAAFLFGLAIGVLGSRLTDTEKGVIALTFVVAGFVAGFVAAILTILSSQR